MLQDLKNMIYSYTSFEELLILSSDDILKDKIYQKNYSEPNFYDIYKKSELYTVKYLDNKKYPLILCENIYSYEYATLNFRFWQFMFSEGYCPLIDIYTCCYQGKWEFINYWDKQGLKFPPSSIDSASRGGHLELVKFLHQKGIKPDENTYVNAMFMKHFHIIKYLLESGVSCNSNVRKYLAENLTDNPEILKLLNLKKKKICLIM